MPPEHKISVVLPAMDWMILSGFVSSRLHHPEIELNLDPETQKQLQEAIFAIGRRIAENFRFVNPSKES